MQEQLNKMQTDISAIKSALIGNDLNPNGIRQRLEKVEIIAADYTANKNKAIGIKWTVAGLMAIIGALFAKLWS